MLTSLTSSQFLRTTTLRAFSLWQHVPLGLPDSILGLSLAFNEDTTSDKVLLGAGTFRDNNGQPFILRSVYEAEKRMLEQGSNHEYATITGLPKFQQLACKLVFGEGCPAVLEGRVASTQTISGTGANRIAGEFFSRFLPKQQDGQLRIHIPRPSWGNHRAIFEHSGLIVEEYPYYDPVTIGLNFDGMVEGLRNVENGSIILFHACAHNPTGVDPSKDQWRNLSALCREKGHICFFDTAYQGFASGCVEEDAFSLRQFLEDGNHLVVAQSFAKNFGLYGERAGALHIVCEDEEEKERVLSQLKLIIRPMYSNPPIHGAKIVETILDDPELKALWEGECRAMSERIQDMRRLLREEIERRDDSGASWQHITDQIGMFCYTGLSPEQVRAVIDEQHVYLTSDGRISMAGVNTHNVHKVAEALVWAKQA